MTTPRLAYELYDLMVLGRPSDGGTPCIVIGYPDTLERMRTQGIEESKDNGTLRDARKAGEDAGFTWPVSIDGTVYEELVAWDNTDNEDFGYAESEQSRLENLLSTAAQKVRDMQTSTNKLVFKISALNRTLLPAYAQETTKQQSEGMARD